MKRLRIAVIMGGRTAEHDISLATGRMVVAGLDRSRYDVVPVVIDREGRWDVRRDGTSPPRRRFRPVGEALSELLRRRIDCVFIGMHGPYGEDGTIQGMMEILDLPYTGSDVTASALAMDKIKTKEIYRSHRIPTPTHHVVEAAEWPGERNALLVKIGREIGFPCVLKPVRLGSSVGISMCANRRMLSKKMARSIRYDGRVLVEQFVKGREVTCAVLDTPGGKPPLPLPPTEIVPKSRAYFDYHAKYTPGASLEVTPAQIGKGMTARVQRLAVRAHRSLGCSGMSRTDMIIDGRRIHVLETNTIPGMTETSLLPQAARAHGLAFPELLDRIIAVAMETYRRRRRFTRVR
ncbi:MAG: D-alanine--D-alanine ligase [Candidatus Aureabacteria bacterium]|nr:D-alanine--D-alanine ligase [Candidatus Auribacterota bacterium]